MNPNKKSWTFEEGIHGYEGAKEGENNHTFDSDDVDHYRRCLFYVSQMVGGRSSCVSNG